jgi:hypothetical protein
MDQRLEDATDFIESLRVTRFGNIQQLPQSAW